MISGVGCRPNRISLFTIYFQHVSELRFYFMCLGLPMFLELS